MRIAIIGWYGTETIGDRAILAGLISLLTKNLGDVSIALGSLHPFFTERTLQEDYPFYQRATGGDPVITLFDSKSPKALRNAIRDSDALVMGGGPLMDLPSMYMVSYAFKVAKRLRKKTLVLGCGLGPLYSPKYQKLVLKILSRSDAVVLRDIGSLDTYHKLKETHKQNAIKATPVVAIDPAVQAVLDYKLHFSTTSDTGIEPYGAVNLRDFPLEYASASAQVEEKGMDESLLIQLSQTFTGDKINLIPMHYFHVGGDDRYYLNNLQMGMVESKNVLVQNIPLTLVQTMDSFANAQWCVGMRFHSVVLQTLLNGRNLVLDYTGGGKTLGFLKTLGLEEVYGSRFIDIQNPGSAHDIQLKVEALAGAQKVNIEVEKLEKHLEPYHRVIKELLN